MEGAVPEDAQVREAKVQRSVSVSGMDREALLVNWLNELLYLQDRDHQVFFRFAIRHLDTTKLESEIAGMPAQNLDKLIKAATFHNLEITQTIDGWVAVVVVDV
jgi:SHS2 domain-containing protein